MNVVCMMGRLCDDPKAAVTKSGKDVENFRIAVDSGVDDAGGRNADFINVTAWGKTGQFVDKYFSKGNMIAIRGHLHNVEWIDKNGNKRTSLEVVAEKCFFCGRKEAAGNASAAGNDNSRKVNEKAADVVYGGDEYAEIDDSEDLPF